MTASTYRAYGLCHCGGIREARVVEVRMNTDTGEPIVLPDVPHGACPVCGGRFYKAELLERIEAIFKGRANDPAISAMRTSRT